MNWSKRYFPLLLIALIAVVWYSCNGLNGQSQPTRLARVADEYLTVEEALKAIPGFMLKQDSIGALRAYRDEWIRTKIVMQEAERLRLRQNDVVQAKLRKAQQDVLAEALKDFIISRYNENLTVTDEEARNFYQANKSKFILNERYVKFRHVETSTYESARAARSALAAGTPWPEVARKYSLNPEVKIQKSEQYWPVSMAVPDLDILNHYLADNVIGITERSPIHRINQTYHFIQLMDAKAEGGHPDLDWLIEQIKEWLLIEKRRRHYSSYIKNLYLKANSNNEIESFNVFTTNSNPTKSTSDTLETNQTSN